MNTARLEIGREGGKSGMMAKLAEIQDIKARLIALGQVLKQTKKEG